jgi:prevent-host-death family protein
MSQHRLRRRRLELVPATAPARGHDIDTLTRAIADGELDAQLLILRDAITQRLDTLTTRSTATALLELSPGDRVEINQTARPKYLHGMRGTIAGLAGQHVIVSLDRPVGRFQSGQLRCHPLPRPTRRWAVGGASPVALHPRSRRADRGTMTMVTMKQVTATRFKAHCLALLDEAAAGEEIIVTKHGRPVARVVAAELPADLKASVTFHVDDDALIQPLDVEWDAAR